MKKKGTEEYNGRGFCKTGGGSGIGYSVLDGTEEGSGDITIFSGAEIASGSSYFAYETQDFAPENPCV